MRNDFTTIGDNVSSPEYKTCRYFSPLSDHLYTLAFVRCFCSALRLHVLPSALLADKVALKILDKTRLDTQAQRLLSREVSSMEFLRHPNVVRLYEVVETPSRLHLVLEYAGGGDLHNKICNEGKLSDNVSKITFAQILSAIKYMVSQAETFISPISFSQ